MQKKILKMNEKYLEKLIEDLNQFDEFWNEKILRDEFKNENSEYFVLVNEDDELCAFAGLWFNIDEAHVMNIAVRKNFRNNGLGSEFMKFLIDRAKQKEKVCITLEVREDIKERESVEKTRCPKDKEGNCPYGNEVGICFGFCMQKSVKEFKEGRRSGKK